jgi:hypothetical protein
MNKQLEANKDFPPFGTTGGRFQKRLIFSDLIARRASSFEMFRRIE